MKRTRELRLGSEMCECPTCGRFFSTTANFDRHRIGAFDDDSRRCLSPAEMTAKGLVEKSGVWKQNPPVGYTRGFSALMEKE